MAKNPYYHDFVLFAEDSSDEKQPSIPYRNLSQRALQAENVYQKQMDNYNEMLQVGFDNWPQETVVGRDSLTWLPKDSLDRICAKLNHKKDDYVACTFHNEPPLSDFKNDEFPVAGSHTYMLRNLPMSMWKYVGNHEKDHHAVSSAKMTAVYDAYQNVDSSNMLNARSVLFNAIKKLDSVNKYMEKTDWLQRKNQGRLTIEKNIIMKKPFVKFC